MNVDHYFEIGKEHSVCQDYALSGIKDDFAYAIVCDGCSSSPDVDVGARLLALSARDSLFFYGDKLGDPEHFIDSESLSKEIIHRAHSACRIFETLRSQCLDSTLLIATVKRNFLRVFLFGDGVIFHKTAKTTHTGHIDFSNNAPSYPSYYLDDRRMAVYLDSGGKKTFLSDFSGSESIEFPNYTKVRTVNPFEPMVISSFVEPGDIISIMSDGINSFCRQNNEPIDWEEMIGEFTGYKNMNGVFVRRRMSALKRKCQSEGIIHEDDISIASIVI